MRIGNTIYLDYQATTPVDQEVLTQMLPYFRNQFGNPHSLDHSIGWRAAQAVEHSAENVANLIGADVDEIVFTSGATEANNLALTGLAKKSTNRRRCRIILSSIEHKCVLEVGHALQKRHGFQVEMLPVDSVGKVNMEQLKETLDDTVLAVSIMAVNNEIGTIQDIPKISRIVKASGAIFHCDAAQAPCAIDLSDITNFVDLLSLSGHKIYGPQGVGVLYISREVQSEIEPLIYGGGQQNNLRSGTVPVPLCVGIGAAATLVRGEQHLNEMVTVGTLRDLFVERILDLPFPIFVNGPTVNQRHPGNTNLRFDGYNAQDLLSRLQPKIAAATGSACTSGVLGTSHVLLEIGLSREQADSSVRFSLGRYTSSDCIDKAVARIYECMKKL